ncbi:uncharacterized protein HGUI_01731 [Hanseniaspora guilliermondii]|uniref:Actin interacting protein 3 C-terminal domain-containing protein n=1 Tax=Hanseniaspora guilliermondii TaxID=56406 RepID=A0A1L0B3J8_9ASCO|nr:uncharacterized protein HGUI_01731 [Hanseniaspora guilliermondii]
MSTPTSLKNPIETNISNLINSTKVFLKALTRWTQQLETQKSISNYYVQLGTDFRVVVKQFTHLGIDMSEVRNVPKELRPILEKALKEKPSNESLDKYWPSIKGIIEDLLNTLKFKRLLLKKLNQEVLTKNQEVNMNTKTVDGLDLNKSEIDRSPSPTKPPSPINVEKTSEPLASKEETSPYGGDNKISPSKSLLDDSADTSASKLDPDSEMKKKKLSNFLKMSGFGDESESSESEEFFDDYDDDEEDVLTSKQMLNALKTDNKIERRASKRYSAYHMAKGNVTSSGNISDPSKLPALPTTGQFSIEKMNDSLNVSSTERAKVNDTDDKAEDADSKLSQEHGAILEKTEDVKPTGGSSNSDLTDTSEIEKLSSNSSATSSMGSNKLLNKLKDKSSKAVYEDEDLIKSHKRSIANSSQSNEKTIYLKYGERTLKRMIEKLNYENVLAEYNKAFGTDFSSSNHDLLVQISDPCYSMFYELEDVNSLERNLQNGSGFEIANNLNTSEHDDKFLELEKKLEIMLDNYEQRIKDEINQKIAMSPSPEPAADKDIAKTDKETLILKKALVKLDKEHKDAMSDMKSKLEFLQKELNEKNELLDELKQKEEQSALVSSFDEMEDNKYVNEVSNKISNDGDMILNKIDDLQDVIEILRKDVAIRGVKPKESNLEKINKTLEETKKELDEFESYLKIQKPELKSKWEKHLIKICDQQQMLTLQEDLVIDLKVDLEKCKETMDLVIKCNKERLKLKNKSHTGEDKMKVILPLTKPSEMQGVRDQLLQDIQLLKPDHQSRIEAIEKHEKFNEINK